MGDPAKPRASLAQTTFHTGSTATGAGSGTLMFLCQPGSGVVAYTAVHVLAISVERAE